jgi:predicted metal-dependent hydrolase
MNASSTTIELNGICIEIIRKKIKNIYLSIHPPHGKVKISAPIKMDLETIKLFVLAKLNWIKKKQIKFTQQEREEPREFLHLESHYFFGKRYLLHLVEHNAVPKVVLQPNHIELHIRKQAPLIVKKAVLQNWYKQQLKMSVQQYIVKLEQELNVQLKQLRIRTMKTKWGTCNCRAKRIWLNTELAKKPIECVEYVMTHEMVHLIERYHNKRFASYMDKLLPQWRHLKAALNSFPCGY